MAPKDGIRELARDLVVSEMEENDIWRRKAMVVGCGRLVRWWRLGKVADRSCGVREAGFRVGDLRFVARQYGKVGREWVSRVEK